MKLSNKTVSNTEKIFWAKPRAPEPTEVTHDDICSRVTMWCKYVTGLPVYYIWTLLTGSDRITASYIATL